jgi:hypothetical protein
MMAKRTIQKKTQPVDQQLLAELKKMNAMLEVINASLPSDPDMSGVESKLDDILRELRRGAR